MRNTEISSMQGNVFLMPRPQPVGGIMIPVDTTVLLLAGTHQISAWLIPLIVSGVGFGIVILRKI